MGTRVEECQNDFCWSQIDSQQTCFCDLVCRDKKVTSARCQSATFLSLHFDTLTPHKLAFLTLRGYPKCGMRAYGRHVDMQIFSFGGNNPHAWHFSTCRQVRISKENPHVVGRGQERVKPFLPTLTKNFCDRCTPR